MRNVLVRNIRGPGAKRPGCLKRSVRNILVRKSWCDMTCQKILVWNLQVRTGYEVRMQISWSKTSGCKTFGSKKSDHFMIVKFTVASLCLWNSWSLLMIEILPVPLYDCDTPSAFLWFLHFLGLCDCGTLHDCETASSITYFITCIIICHYWKKCDIYQFTVDRLKINWVGRIRGNVILLIFSRIWIQWMTLHSYPYSTRPDRFHNKSQCQW